jgi:hypothetical protein
MTLSQARRILGVPKKATLEEIRTRAKKGESNGNADDDEKDFATEWHARESELAAVWRKLREDWLSKPLMDPLLQQVEQQINSYSSVSQLRESIRKDMLRVISDYLLHVNHELQGDVGRVASLFNQKVNEMYFPLFEQVRTLRLSHLVTDKVFLWSTASSVALLTVGAAIGTTFWPDAPAYAPPVVAFTGVPVGYLLSRWILRRPPGQLAYLEVPSIRYLVNTLQAPNALAKEDPVKGGLLLAAADFLADFELEELAIVGAILAGLSLFFGKSLARVKSDTLAELGPKVRQAIDFRAEVEKLLNLYWTQLVQDAYKVYAENRRIATQYAGKYAGLLESSMRNR